MKEKFIRYILITFLSSQVILIGYLSLYFFINQKAEEYSKIKLSGNNLLSSENYIELIPEKENEVRKSLNFIKRRIESHPYVLKADVRLTSKNILEISVQEKQLSSIIIKNSESYFITRDFELIKIIPFTSSPSLPLLVIDDNKNLSIAKDEQIILAFKVIDSLKELNEELSQKLTEINLLNKDYLVLLFRGINAPVLMNKSNFVKELVSLNEFMMMDNSVILDSNTRYIDLRFNNQIIIG